MLNILIKAYSGIPTYIIIMFIFSTPTELCIIDFRKNGA